MVANGSSGRRAREQTRRAARRASPWIERLARIGYLAYGVVYLLVGILAIQAALGGGGKTASQEGALRSMLAAPLGRFLLGGVALGLAGYAIWRLVQGILDPEYEGRDPKGIVKRVNHVTNGLFHGALALSAGRLALGSGDQGGGSPDDWTARLLVQPFGPWLVAIVGAIIVAAGLHQFYEAYRATFRFELKLGEMGMTETTWATRSGRFGHTARGVVFGIIGVLLIQASLQSDPDEARGLGGALQTLARQPFGTYLLGAVALGLISYGIFMFVVARYRRIRPPESG